LAVQAGTDTLNDDDRDSIDLEFQALGDEIGRIASSTEYDDNKLLDGTYTGKSLQIGADNDANHQLSISIGDATVDGLGVGKLRGLGKTELAADIDSSVTTITVDSSAGLSAGDTIVIGDEQMTIASGGVNADGTTLTVTREAGNTTAASHSTDDAAYYDADVESVGHARAAITGLDHAIDAVNEERSKIGAVQNRLSFTISNLSNHTQAIEAGRSAIADVDFAAEATALARNQILAQSGTAMLAQASAVSQNVLGLLM